MCTIRHNGFKAIACLLVCCVFFSAYPYAQAADTLVSAPLIIRKDTTNGMVRVYLSSLGNPGTLNITVSGSYTVNGLSSMKLASGSSVTVDFNSITGRLTLTAGGISRSMGNAFKLRRHSLSGSNGLKIRQARVSGNLYPGDLSFVSVPSGSTYKLYTVAYIFMEDYLYGVLPYEMGGSAPGEALKAQAVTARTYTLKAMASASSRLYDVVDTTSDQVYSGTPSGSSACEAAVDATRGIVSMIGGSFTATYYTASNGGQIESVKNLWGSAAYGYIVVKDDPYDFGNPDSRVRSFAVSSGPAQNPVLAQLLQAKAVKLFGTSDVAVTAVTNIVPHTPRYPVPSRLYTMIDFYINATVQGAGRSGILTFNIFAELEAPLALGINTSANELWTVNRTDAGFMLKARRYGHGTGLSQRGAMYMAKLGYTYAQILAFYFEGCTRVQYSLVSSILSPVVDGIESTELSATQTPAELTEAEPCTAIVSLSSGSARTALRGSARDDGDVITMLKHGAEVSVYTISGSWCLVKYGELCGYVKKSYLVISGMPSGSTAVVTRLRGYGVVTGTGSLNLRKSPSMTAVVLAQLPRGAILPLISLSSGWAYTQFERLAGYVYVSLLTQYSRYPVSVIDSTPGALVSSQSGTASFRMSPSNTAYVIAELANGTAVSVKYDDGSWCRVLHDGMTGYILSSVLTYTDKPVDESEDMVGPGEYAATSNPVSSSLNLRLSASSTSEIIAEIPKGDSLIVATKGSVWCAVRYRGVPGFVMTKYLLFTQVTDTSVANARVNTVSGSLNLRAAASSTAAVLITIPQNTILPVYEKGTQWCRVGYNGRIGYVMTNYLSFIAEPTATPEPSPTPAATPSPAVTAAPTTSPAVISGQARVSTPSGSLNLREAAYDYARVLTTIPRDTVIAVLSRGTTWSKVQYKGYTGYVMTKFLDFSVQSTASPAPSGTPQMLPEWLKDGCIAKVNTVSGSLNLRATPSTSAHVIITIPQYAEVTVKTAGMQWCAVTYGANSGYVMTGFLAAVDKSGNNDHDVTLPTAENPSATQAAGL